ncbi:lactate utilization protein [Deferribacterales bacterium RsTz2092]|nr:hypothetical protein AGMMS49941_06210 [Deferribacterales bacterium]
MSTPFDARNEKFAPLLVAMLKERGFDAHYAKDRVAALNTAISLIPAEHVVSWGGATSADEIGLIDAVKKRNKVIDRDTAKDIKERWTLMKNALHCDTFIMGTNAMSESGELVNIDGNGNRIAALAFGPSSVIVIVGINKVAKTLDDAISRARNTAAPINAQRFPERKTPCVTKGACFDCKSDECICNQISIVRMCSPAKRIKVIIVGESLGF